ncbi:DUF3127 domain-containing protein [Taibaiella soli]|uniref:DUF3127 domain-containing protein n=1 Tax=Taibaiella soli TaxID=1649169 RepID=A0A2W2BAS3_9BACT|nr:DUF3127 domain-containing protein [Taibaiella soli]PZF72987.1 hypothetical protein DN068_11290 [Taibaiella soli]
MSLEVIGKLHVKYDAQQVNDRFRKREFVMELSEEINGNVYTNYAKMQLVQNKCDILDRFNEGDPIKVSFNIKGNRWEKDGKVNFITNLDAWRIEPAAAGMNNGGMQQQSQPMNNGYNGNNGGYNNNGGGYNNGGNYNQGMNQNAGNNGGNGNFYNPSPESVDDLPF